MGKKLVVSIMLLVLVGVVYVCTNPKSVVSQEPVSIEEQVRPIESQLQDVFWANRNQIDSFVWNNLFELDTGGRVLNIDISINVTNVTSPGE